jgi:hypothetical protein
MLTLLITYVNINIPVDVKDCEGERFTGRA